MSKNEVFSIKIIILIVFVMNLFTVYGIYNLYTKSPSADASVEEDFLREKITIKNIMKSFVLDNVENFNHKKEQEIEKIGYKIEKQKEYFAQKKEKQEIYTFFVIEEKNKEKIKIECFDKNDVLLDVYIKKEESGFSNPDKIKYFELYKIETNNYIFKKVVIHSLNKIKRVSINGNSLKEYNQKLIDPFIEEINNKEIELDYKPTSLVFNWFLIIISLTWLSFCVVMMMMINGGWSND